MIVLTRSGEKLTPAELHRLTVQACRALPGYSELAPPDRSRVYLETRAEIVRKLAKTS